ncbi:GntR family transcriptional regulator [Variovorax sp. LjRoot84]|uniref:GntR family transcriptional regulator n=1 Tax=Variovorax sp. LjRoot84 TaxID=3342340 RepID=UPI003F50F1B0
MGTPSGRPQGLSRALYEELRARIGDGTFAPGSTLPSTRALAAERGLSRTTVSTVYDQLAADGFIDSRAGAASRVALEAHHTSCGHIDCQGQPGPPHGASKPRIDHKASD